VSDILRHRGEGSAQVGNGFRQPFHFSGQLGQFRQGYALRPKSGVYSDEVVLISLGHTTRFFQHTNLLCEYLFSQDTLVLLRLTMKCGLHRTIPAVDSPRFRRLPEQGEEGKRSGGRSNDLCPTFYGQVAHVINFVRR
jgi:hypothetical protein